MEPDGRGLRIRKAGRIRWVGQGEPCEAGEVGLVSPVCELREDLGEAEGILSWEERFPRRSVMFFEETLFLLASSFCICYAIKYHLSTYSSPGTPRGSKPNDPSLILMGFCTGGLWECDLEVLSTDS